MLITGLVFVFCGGHFFEFHAALRALTWLLADYFRVHGAGIGNACYLFVCAGLPGSFLVGLVRITGITGSK